MLKGEGAVAGWAHGNEGERARRQLRQRARNAVMAQEQEEQERKEQERKEQERKEQERMMGHQRTWGQRAQQERAETGGTRAPEHRRCPAAALPGT